MNNSQAKFLRDKLNHVAGKARTRAWSYKIPISPKVKQAKAIIKANQKIVSEHEKKRSAERDRLANEIDRHKKRVLEILLFGTTDEAVKAVNDFCDKYK